MRSITYGPRQAQGSDEDKLKPWTMDRDVNASWNMAWVGTAWLASQPRPYWLSRRHAKALWPQEVRDRYNGLE